MVEMVPTVHLILILHDKEGVVVQIAEELDVGPAITLGKLTGLHVNSCDIYSTLQ